MDEAESHVTPRSAVAARKDVLVVRPQPRDVWSIEDACLQDRYRVHYAHAGLDLTQPLHVGAYLARAARIRADGVVGTHDNAALLAALVARGHGLPGPTPEAVFACQYKPESRRRQRAAAPSAVPRHAPFHGATAFAAPFYLKPVFGTLSGGVRRIDALSDLDDVEVTPHARGYAAIAETMGLCTADACGYLMEEVMTGDEVTLEGYVLGGRFVAVGVTDSVKYAGTDSFERFEYPTRLSQESEAELVDVARLVVAGLGFDDGMLNFEFFVPERGPVKITEVNARIASQYAPLVKALHGRSTYELLFALACGEDPAWRAARPDGVAISYCLRAFGDAFVERVPEPQHGLEILVEPGRTLAEQGHNDPHSYRLAIFYETGETREEALARCRARARGLDFGLTDRRALAVGGARG